MDGLPQIFGMIRPAEGTGQPGRREDEGEHLAVELADLGVRLHEGPRAALDLGEGLQDLRPGAAKNLDVGTRAGRCRCRALRGRLCRGRFRPCPQTPGRRRLDSLRGLLSGSGPGRLQGLGGRALRSSLPAGVGTRCRSRPAGAGR
jgi:hypothetical protein